MTKTELAQDIDYVRALAEEGRTAPPIGGRFMVLWGVLFPAMLVTHWAIVTEGLAISPGMLLWLWLGMGLAGGAVSVLLGSASDKLPGASAANNRVTSAVWSAMPLGLLAVFVGGFACIEVFDGPLLLWNVMPAVALVLYGVAYLTTSFFLKSGIGIFSGVVSLMTGAGVLALCQQPEAYLVAAAGVVIGTLIPGAVLWAREPKLVV
jgi:hypothetical protein